MILLQRVIFYRYCFVNNKNSSLKLCLKNKIKTLSVFLLHLFNTFYNVICERSHVEFKKNDLIYIYIIYFSFIKIFLIKGYYYIILYFKT